MQEFDRKKPRFRTNSLRTLVVTEQLYKEWKQENPELKKYINSFGSFKKYWKSVATEIQHEVSSNPLGVKLPFFCGELSVKYTEIEALDRNRTTDISNKIPLLNWHSFSKVGKLIWDIEKAAKFNTFIKFYGLKGVREFNVRIARSIEEYPEKFKSVRFCKKYNYTAKKKALQIIEQRKLNDE